MSSIITVILKPTVGLLVNKGRDLAAEKLKDGDITDQKFRKLLVRELEEIKSKIDGLAMKDLSASVMFFKDGLQFLYQLLDQPELREATTANARTGTEDEKLAVSLPSASGGPKLSINTSSLVEELKMLKLNELNETAKQLLADAKKRFDDARRRAIDAFSNEGLQVTDRILATKICIMATLMEKVDSPSTALPSCRLFLEELHNIPAVQNCFEVEITKPLKYSFNKNERREVIAEVCHTNFVIYSVTRMVDHDWRDVFKLPVIGELKMDPLHDAGLIKALSEFKLEKCCLLERTFGQEGKMNHRLDSPQSITTNTQGQFIVVDRTKDVKVFDRSGKFLRSLNPLTEDQQKQLQLNLFSVATDRNDNLFVLASLKKEGMVERPGVYVFDQHYNLHHKFPLREEVYLSYNPSLTVSNDGKVFILVWCDGVLQVDVYETDGRLVDSFGRGILSQLVVRGITTANDDSVMVMDGNTHCVHVISSKGDHLHTFPLQGYTTYGAIAFHHPSEHVIVSSWNPENENRGQVSIYTKDGEFVRSVQLNTEKTEQHWLLGLTVTVDGRVAVTNCRENKVHIISF